MEDTKTKLLFDKNYVADYQNKLMYCLKNGFIYGTIFAILFRKPLTYYPLAFGLAFGYCHSDLKKVFIIVKEKENKLIVEDKKI